MSEKIATLKFSLHIDNCLASRQANRSNTDHYKDSHFSCIKNSKMNWSVSKPRIYTSMYRSSREHTSPCILQPGQLLWRWERVGVTSARLRVKIHLHHKMAITWGIGLVCVKCCGKPQQHWCHDTCGAACVSLGCVPALRSHVCDSLAEPGLCSIWLRLGMGWCICI